MLGLDVRIVKDVGAYHYFSVHEPTNTINHLPSQYKIPAFRAEGSRSSPTRRRARLIAVPGGPEAILVVERLLDRLAAKLGLDPREVRARNQIAPAEMPYRPGLVYRDGVPVSCDGGDYPLELRRALDLLDYAGWRKRQADLRADGRRIGLGIAGYLEAGGSVRPGEWATVKVDDRGHVEVLIGVSGSGQGHETVSRRCAPSISARRSTTFASAAGARPVPYGYGTGASRVAVNTGNAVAVAAADVKVKACRVASRLLECAPDDVRIEHGRAFVVGTPDARFRSPRSPAWPERPGPRRARRPRALGHEVLLAAHGDLVERRPRRCRGGRRGDRPCRHPPLRDRARLRRQLHPVIVDGQIVGGFAQGLGVVPASTSFTTTTASS